MRAEYYVVIVVGALTTIYLWWLTRSDELRAERRRMRKLKSELRAQLPSRKHQAGNNRASG